MKPTVVITQKVHDEVIQYLDQYCIVVPNTETEPLGRPELIARAADAHGMMVFMPDSIDEEFLAACPRLRIVAAALKGFDNFDVQACTRRGIWFSIVPDLLTVPTADLTVGLLLCLTRNLLTGDRQVRSGAFDGWRPHLYGTGLSGATAGIIGMGAVGLAVASRLRAFDMTILCHDIQPVDPKTLDDIAARSVSLDELLCSSDIVLPLLPLTPDTLHLMSRERIALMKPGAFLINAGRGSVVDEAAVADSLANGHLGGYAADVFEMEDWARPDRPSGISPALLAMKDKTVFTPHIGSAVGSVRREIEMDAARSIVEALQGFTPHGAVNRPMK